MKRFYKTTALLVSLLGISNISCGELGGAIAIHETEEIGQARLHFIEGVGELLKNGEDYFKEHLAKWIIVAVVVGREVFSLYRWWSAVPVLTKGDVTQFFALTGRRYYGPAWKFISESKKKYAKDVCGETLLHKAVYRGDIGAILVLLAAGANKDARDNVGRTPLHKAANEGYAGTVQVLVDAGADKDLTPLHKNISYKPLFTRIIFF
ncbi:MAG: ankyrin repeat domain-containing protein [Holosporales bacterium]|jgi:hypothetical protein|nr:ankyrin repeat domain-containing protein [Holosporales bacterium]